MLQLKSEETIYELFNWGQGEFGFQDNELPGYTMVPQAIAVQNLMLEGMRRVDEWKRIRDEISSAQAVPVSVVDLLDDPEIGEGERQVLALVDDDRSIEEICLQTHSSEFYVSRIVFESCRKGKLKVVRPRTEGGQQQATVSEEVVESGFMLSRINGQYDVQSLLRLTPLPPLDGLLVLGKLLNAGYIGLKE